MVDWSRQAGAASPVVVNDEVFLSACYGTGAVVFRLGKDGPEEVWKSDDAMSNHYGTCVYRDGFLYGFDGTLRTFPKCVDLRKGLDVPGWGDAAGLESGTFETPKPGDAVFAGHEVQLIATPQESLEAAAAFARDAGIEAHILSDEIEGESRDVGKVHAALAPGGIFLDVKSAISRDAVPQNIQYWSL